MSTAVMQNSTLYDFGEMLLQHQQQSNMGGTSRSSSNVSPITTTSPKSSIRWGFGEQRAVGSPLNLNLGGDDTEHEALSRRASHPVQSAASLLTSLLLNDINTHRRLDRSQSEPAKTLVNVNTSRYKTELCRPYEESGECKYGDKCQFAHGCHELRNLVRHPKYKTELCRTFHTVGFCPYGPRCHFIHNAEEERLGMQKPKTRPPCLISGSLSTADTPSPPSSLGSVSPPPSATANTAFSFAPIVPPLDSPSMSPSRSPSPPGSPDTRLPVFNGITVHLSKLVV